MFFSDKFRQLQLKVIWSEASAISPADVVFYSFSYWIFCRQMLITPPLVFSEMAFGGMKAKDFTCSASIDRNIAFTNLAWVNESSHKGFGPLHPLEVRLFHNFTSSWYSVSALSSSTCSRLALFLATSSLCFLSDRFGLKPS